MSGQQQQRVELTGENALTVKEARALGAFAGAFREVAKDADDLHGHESLPHMGSACAKLYAALSQTTTERNEG